MSEMTNVQTPRGAPVRTPKARPQRAELPARRHLSRRTKRLSITGAAVALGAVVTLVIALLVTTGGGETNSVTTTGGTTYSITNVTVADSAAGITQPGLFPYTHGVRLIDPFGTYVAVQMTVTGGGTNAADAATPTLVDGNGAAHKDSISSVLYDVSSGASAPTRVDVYDIPDAAVAGSHLQIVESGTTYTLDLGL